MKNLVILISLSLAIATGCQKDSVTVHHVNPALLSAYGFNKGTYWIYQDSMSGVTDSFAIVFPPYINQSTGGNIINDYYNYTISIFRNNEKIFSWDVSLMDTSFFMECLNSPVESQITYQLFNYPIYPNQQLQPYDSGGVTNITSNYTNYGINFSNVASIHHYNRSINDKSPEHDDWFYTADNIGFVKIVFNHPQDSVYRNWNLLRYHIVK